MRFHKLLHGEHLHHVCSVTYREFVAALTVPPPGVRTGYADITLARGRVYDLRLGRQSDLAIRRRVGGHVRGVALVQLDVATARQRSAQGVVRIAFGGVYHRAMLAEADDEHVVVARFAVIDGAHMER